MELKLYQQLKAGLLDSLAGVSERPDAAYQHGVERYAPEAESGIKPWGARPLPAGWRNLLAYWMATGNGKTLLMHLNILQYIEHLGGLQAFDELQLILTTPGVNLIEQHRQPARTVDILQACRYCKPDTH